MSATVLLSLVGRLVDSCTIWLEPVLRRRRLSGKTLTCLCVCCMRVGVWKGLRSMPLSKQPSFVKLFRLSAHLPACFSVSYPHLPACCRVPWFLRIGPAELILSQLPQGFVRWLPFVARFKGWKIIHHLPHSFFRPQGRAPVLLLTALFRATGKSVQSRKCTCGHLNAGLLGLPFGPRNLHEWSDVKKYFKGQLIIIQISCNCTTKVNSAGRFSRTLASSYTQNMQSTFLNPLEGLWLSASGVIVNHQFRYALEKKEKLPLDWHGGGTTNGGKKCGPSPFKRRSWPSQMARRPLATLGVLVSASLGRLCDTDGSQGRDWAIRQASFCHVGLGSCWLPLYCLLSGLEQVALFFFPCPLLCVLKLRPALQFK